MGKYKGKRVLIRTLNILFLRKMNGFEGNTLLKIQEIMNDFYGNYMSFDTSMSTPNSDTATLVLNFYDSMS